ncbi:TetR/AcrR family transcriptional regulator [Saccharothrix variisporea]|uniref:TetR family transcriptional regulator n=1 Tax=Saccharothrix variisporea TaxID=543527 RepID=A0A495XA43_9PSEU|nr:TetR/AcrR family transcriptional regulator [Saccharothrix variisporea]RKT68398.1 TetR family transcriptional regulator [Saccharothrix variisporea]
MAAGPKAHAGGVAGVRTRRAETQERNRAKVLAAAREEFAERGFRDAKVDAIAQRVGLTRGAVYSNFPGKRALYFAVLADLAEQAYPPAVDGGRFADPGPDGGAFALKRPAEVADNAGRRAFGALALAWVRPLAADDWLGRDLLPELLAEDVRRPYTQLLGLDALLLGLAVERLRPPNPNPADPPIRRVRHARALLTTLLGATQLAASAPGLLEPYDVVTAVEQLADLPINDFWAPPPSGPPVRRTDEPWNPPPATDLVRGTPHEPAEGVVAVLGLNRLDAVEQAARHGETTVVLVTGAPQELAPLARLTVAQLTGPLRQAFPPATWPDLRVVCDETGEVARAAGVPAVSDETEVAVRVRDGRIVARADGFAACHAIATETT